MQLMDGIAIIGTAAFAISGYLVGVRKQLDVLGIVIVALLTAIGGGIIRDVLVSRLPRVFFDNLPLWVIGGTLLASWLLRLQHKEKRLLSQLFIVADSLGLVAFSLTGAQVGIYLDLNLFGVVLLAFVTAVGGGIVRDMMVNDIPFILHKDFYGSVSILVGALLYLLDHWKLNNALTLQLLFALGLAVRLGAHWKELSLPKITAHKK